MRYAKIENYSIANGDGLRVVLWCQGCSLHCKGCHNSGTWDFNSGLEWTKESEDYLFELLNNNQIKGITFSGGHPLEKENIFEVSKIVTRIKCELPDKDIWLYTGWKYEDLLVRANKSTTAEDKILKKLLSKIDILVDGPFIEELRDLSLAYRGSSNQRIIDVKESLQSGTIISYK